MNYTLHIMPIEINETEIKEIKKLGFHDWIFQQAELKNIECDWIEKDELLTVKKEASKWVLK